jgi:hypothetical protein
MKLKKNYFCRPVQLTTIRVFASVRESKDREKLAVSKRATQTFNTERFNIKKLR